MNLARVIPLAAIVLAGTSLLAQAEPPSVRFEDVSKSAGMVLVHRSQNPNPKIATTQPNFVNLYAKGFYWSAVDVAFLDIDGDGKLDLFMLASPHSHWSRLWLGDGKGGFAEVDANQLSPGPVPDAPNYRVLGYDFFGRGAQDLVITGGEWGGLDPQKGSLRLTGSTSQPGQAAGLRTIRALTWTEGATHLYSDFDGDGVIDVAIGPYFDRGSPQGGNFFAGGAVIGGVIELDRVRVPVAVGSQSVAADFDGDGRCDILARGYWTKTVLSRNLGKRRFADVTEAAGLAGMPSGGPIAVGDFTNSGRLDIFCCGSGPSGGGPRLYLNDGQGKFKDATAGSGLELPARPAWPSFGGAIAADFNNDGLVDIFYVDGRTPRLYLNQGQGKFKEVTQEAGLTLTVANESTVAAGDYDNDGLIDLAVISPDHGPTLLHNASAKGNHYMNVQLKGPRGNPEAAGSAVWVYRAGKCGDAAALLSYQQMIISTDFKLPRPLHFGLGPEKSCDIRVRFPDGKVVDLRAVPADGCAVVNYPAATTQPEKN